MAPHIYQALDRGKAQEAHEVLHRHLSQTRDIMIDVVKRGESAES